MVTKKVSKKDLTRKKIEYLIYKLSRVYTPEKTEEDYEKILQELTRDSILIDVTLKAWEKILKELESG